MAPRLNKRHQDMVVAKIQTSQLFRRLQDHVDGKNKMSPTQIQAAKILIDKSVGNAPSEINLNATGLKLLVDMSGGEK